MNPHKWMFTPFDASLLLFRRPEVFRDAFSLVPEYLRTNDAHGVRNYHEYGIQLGRRFRALKLWFMLRYFGAEGMAARIREHCRLAQLFTGWLDADPDWQRLAPVPFSTAEKEWRRALVLDTSSFRVRLQLADLLDRQGRTERRQGFIGRASKQDSTFPAALERPWEPPRQEAADSEPCRFCDRQSPHHPGMPGSTRQMGTALSKTGKADSARTMLATSLALSPSNVTVMVQLGSLYLDKKAYEDAFRLFRVAAQAQPWNSDILFKAGLCREKTEDLDVATDYYRKAALADTATFLRSDILVRSTSSARCTILPLSLTEPQRRSNPKTPGLHQHGDQLFLHRFDCRGYCMSSSCDCGH